MGSEVGSAENYSSRILSRDENEHVFRLLGIRCQVSYSFHFTIFFLFSDYLIGDFSEIAYDYLFGYCQAEANPTFFSKSDESLLCMLPEKQFNHNRVYVIFLQ